MRVVTISVGLVDLALWLAAAAATFFSGSDPATHGLDIAAGATVTVLFLVTGAPALMLAMGNRAPRTALAMALAFPAALVVFLAVAVLALP